MSTPVVKIVMLFFSAVACVQVIKPLGWPGLKTRQDAWKLVVFGMIAAFLMLAVTAGFKSDVSSGVSGLGGNAAVFSESQQQTRHAFI
ncbi:MAG: hypothetical protein ACR2O4_10715 [Hyphomicrobiaceae bacterium]